MPDGPIVDGGVGEVTTTAGGGGFGLAESRLRSQSFVRLTGLIVEGGVGGVLFRTDGGGRGLAETWVRL